MSVKVFNDEQIKKLLENPYVKKASEKSIQYSTEFKIYFIKQYLAGDSPTRIFEKAGFDKSVLGNRRIQRASSRWRKIYEEYGELGFTHPPKKRGRSCTKELSNEEIIQKQKAQIEFLKAEVELLKKLDLIERRGEKNNIIITKSEIFSIISIILERYNLTRMTSHLCKCAGVSRSGYYRYLATVQKREKREKADEVVRDIILNAINYKGYKKGSRSIKMVLEGEFNIIYNRKRIQRIMRKYNILCPIRKRNPYKQMRKKTTEHFTFKNILDRKFKDHNPREVLLTDITYLKYGQRKTAYLSTILDSKTNEILAYNISKKIDLLLVKDTFKKLLKHHSHDLHERTIVHSDQGWHYTNPKLQKYLKGNNISQSMSRKGNCWDNAPQESFFGHLKDEVDIDGCQEYSELCLRIDDYMDYHNNYRYQWNLKKMTPVKYRNHLLAS